MPALPASAQERPLLAATLAGVLDAGSRGARVAALWVRQQAGIPLQVFVSAEEAIGGSTGKRAEARPADDRQVGSKHRDGLPEEVALAFPLGARGRMVLADEVAQLMQGFEWVSCGGHFDPLSLRADRQPGLPAEGAPEVLDRQVEYLHDTAFAWLVIAIPRPAAALDAEMAALRRELYRLRQRDRLSESDAVRVERGEAWFRELAGSGSAGLWDVGVHVGGPDQTASRGVAAALCSAAELSVTGYRIRPISVETSTALSLRGLPDSGDRDQTLLAVRNPFPAAAELVACLARPPLAELSGVRLVTEPSFDTTPEVSSHGEDSVVVGQVLDRFRRPVGPLRLPIDSLQRHTFVCGATGGGKSQTVRSLLEALSRRDPPLPWLVIEPAKAEYARMAGRLAGAAYPEVLVIRPGDLGAPPASLNPLEPATLEPGNPGRTFPLQSHADLVRALFLAAFRAEEPFPQVLSRALSECYEAAGWDLVTGEGAPRQLASLNARSRPAGGQWIPRFPSLADLQSAAREVVGQIGYDEDIKKRVRGFVDVRVGSLRQGAPGRFFEGGHPLDVAALLRRNVVLEVDSITNDQDKAFVMGTILIRLYEQLLLEERERFLRQGTPARLRHVTVLEEAHRLLRHVESDSPAAHSIELFAGLLAEVRSYGEGLVVAEQIPAKILVDVVKNTAVKVVHRLPAADDRALVGATMNLSPEQAEYVVSLTPGVAAVFADGMDRPLLAAMDWGEGREADAEVDRMPPLRNGGRRSSACGAHCTGEGACTLQTMRSAERLLEQHAQLVFWVEASCVAHGMGGRSPGLANSVATLALRELAVDQPRLVQCAVAHAVDRAVSVRYRRMSAFFDPDAFARHLSEAAWQAIIGGEVTACATDRGDWRMGLDRLKDVEQSLEAAVEGRADTRSAAEAAEVARRRGSELGPGPATDQLRRLRTLPWRRYPNKEQYALLVGDLDAPAALVAATGLFGSQDMADLLGGAMQYLAWPSEAARDGVLARMKAALASTAHQAPS